MPNITNLIKAISNDVVAKMAAAGLPPLKGGKILIGKDKKNENSFPPRIVFIPVSVRWGAPSPGANSSPINPLNANAPGMGVRSATMTCYGSGYAPGATVIIGAPDVPGGVQATATVELNSNGCVRRIIMQNSGSGYLRPPTVTFVGTGVGATASANMQQTPQALATISQRSVRTELHKFIVDVWGVHSVNGVVSRNHERDYDATQQLYQQVIASAQLLAAGVHDESSGQWLDALPSATSIDVVGRGFRFMLEIQSPVPAEPMVPTSGPSVQYAPAPTQMTPTLTMQLPSGGTPEQA